MSDKEVERNVRSTSIEGIRTPTERHTHGIGEKHAIAFGEKARVRKTRERLLEKFRRLEQKRKSAERQSGEGAVER